MKRKLLNAALFGAVLVAAPVSTFVSCADYDADITGLQQTADDLKEVVNQKETTIKNQIADLEAQDKAFADKLAALEEAQNGCKTNCANELAQCKADCAAARALLQAAIDDLKAALAAAETKHGDDVATLLARDNELQKGIDAAKADIDALNNRLTKLEGEVQTLAEGLNTTQGDVQILVEGLKGLQVQVNTLETELGKVDDKLDALKALLQGEIQAVRDLVNSTKSELLAQITANATEITALSDALKAHKAEYDQYKKDAAKELQDAINKNGEEFRAWVENTLNPGLAELDDRIGDLETGAIETRKDLMELQSLAHDLETDVIAHGDQIGKNTKAIVDLAVRMVEAESAIAEATEKLALLTADFEAYKVEQHALDVAQDAALAGVIAEFTVDGVTYNFENINEAYKAALDYALQAALVAESNAKAYADGNFYNKVKVDELVAALQAADAQRDADFQMWQEQVLLPLFADVWGELLDENGDSRLSVIEAGLSITQADVTSISEGLMELTTQANGNTIKIAEVEEAYKAADAKIAEDFRAWIEQELNPAFADVYEAIANLDVELSAEVKSLVLEPANYYQGIQAIEGDKIVYYNWDIDENTGVATKGSVSKEYAPVIYASYHVNPSTANLSTDKADYKFKTEDRINRGTSNLAIDITDVKKVDANGMLKLTLKIDDATKNATGKVNAAGDKCVSVAALQYTNKAAKSENQVITSDYAVIYLEEYKGINVNFKGDNTDLSVNSGVDNGYGTAKVEFTDNIDVTTLINTHVGESTSTEYWEQEDVTEKGFHYEYVMVGDNKEFFVVDKETGVVTPKWYDGEKQSDATIANVGMEGTVLVILKQGDNIASVGYLKVTVTGESKQVVADEVTIEDKFEIQCDPVNDPAISHTVSLQSLYEKVIATTNLTKEKALENYTLAEYADGNAVQYVRQEDGKFVALDESKAYGVVAASMGGHTEWPAVVWEINYLTASTDLDKTETVYVCVEHTVPGTEITNQFFLPIKWAPAKYEEWKEVEATIYYDKVGNQWQESMGQHAYGPEIRVYPDLVYGNDAKYEVDLFTKAIKGDVTFKFNDNEYVDLSDASRFAVTKQRFVFKYEEHVNAPFTFVDEDGIETTYFFSVSADGTQLLAATSPKGMPSAIANIDENGKITLENNAYTQNILNHSEEWEYGKSLYAHVAYQLETCAGAVTVTNGEFDVCFIQPITINANPIKLDDASTGIASATILDNIVCFNGKSFLADRNLFNVFGVSIELGDPADWKTNYDAAADDFSKSVSEHKSLQDNEGNSLFGKTEDHKNGKYEVTFRNNGNSLSQFQVKVPVTVTYVWGDINPLKAEVVLTVGKTLGGSNRR